MPSSTPQLQLIPCPYNQDNVAWVKCLSLERVVVNLVYKHL